MSQIEQYKQCKANHSDKIEGLCGEADLKPESNALPRLTESCRGTGGPKPLPVHRLYIRDHEFRLIGASDGGASIETSWGNGDEYGEAKSPCQSEQIARAVIESHILALYCSGALMQNDAFHPKVVESLTTTIDNLEKIIDRFDEEVSSNAEYVQRKLRERIETE